MNKIKHLLDVVDEVRDHVALGLMSDPGLSKTSQVKQWAEEHGRTYCELIISQRMPSEISGIPMPVSESQTMEVFDYQTLLELKDGDVLAFDEFTNGNIQTLNACLTLIQERTMLSGKKLPSLLIVAMGNPQGRCELLPQTKQRFLWVDVHWDAPSWKRYMQDAWGISVTKPVLDAIGSQYKDGFAGNAKWNYLTPRTMENLFRIARKRQKADIFWGATEISSVLIGEIYVSLGNISEFRKMEAKLEEWSKNMIAQDPADRARANFIERLEECGSMADIRELIMNPTVVNDYVTILPEFITWLRSTGLSEESAASMDFGDATLITDPVRDPGFRPTGKPHKSVLNPTSNRRF